MYFQIVWMLVDVVFYNQEMYGRDLWREISFQQTYPGLCLHFCEEQFCEMIRPRCPYHYCQYLFNKKPSGIFWTCSIGSARFPFPFFLAKTMLRKNLKLWSLRYVCHQHWATPLSQLLSSLYSRLLRLSYDW